MSRYQESESLLDIVETCQAVMSLTDGLDDTAFLDDLRSQWAILHGITVLGEATKRLSREFRSGHPAIPRRRVDGMRDILVHDYDEVDLYEVWRVATIEVPALLAAVQPRLAEAE